MSWKIQLIENTVKIQKKCALQLFNFNKSIGYAIYAWEFLDEVLDQGYIYFSEEDNEHMDYLSQYEEIIKILCSNNVRGDICFCSHEGDNKGICWKHSFDGLGRYKRFEGKIQMVFDDLPSLCTVEGEIQC